MQHDNQIRDAIVRRQREEEEQRRRAERLRRQEEAREQAKTFWNDNKKSEFRLNFLTFKKIFSSRKPQLVYDFLFFVALLQYPGVEYRETVPQLLALSRAMKQHLDESTEKPLSALGAAHFIEEIERRFRNNPQVDKFLLEPGLQSMRPTIDAINAKLKTPLLRSRTPTLLANKTFY